MSEQNYIPNNQNYQSWQDISDADKDVIKAKINLETSTANWSDLERFFAQGLLILVDPSLDLIETAWHIKEDHAKEVESLMNDQLLGQISTSDAKQFHASNQTFWCVVLKPWVLIQPYNSE